MPDLTQKIKKLPSKVQQKLASKKTVEKNKEIAKKHGLSLEEAGRMVNIISRTITKDIALENFQRALRDQFPDFNKEKIRNMALDIAKRRFLPLKEWLKGAEDLVRDLGGKTREIERLRDKETERLRDQEIKGDEDKVAAGLAPAEAAEDRAAPRAATTGPEDLDTKTQSRHKHTPKESKHPSGQAAEGEQPIGAGIVKKPIREGLQEFPQLKDQHITSQPIMIEEFNKPVKPTLGNWLKDYLQRMGAGYHDSMQRSTYLYKTENAQKLDASEKMILSEILKSYDEKIPIPINPENQKIVLSELISQDSRGRDERGRQEGSASNPKLRGNILDLRDADNQ